MGVFIRFRWIRGNGQKDSRPSLVDSVDFYGQLDIDETYLATGEVAKESHKKKRKKTWPGCAAVPVYSLKPSPRSHQTIYVARSSVGKQKRATHVRSLVTSYSFFFLSFFLILILFCVPLLDRDRKAAKEMDIRSRYQTNKPTMGGG